MTRNEFIALCIIHNPAPDVGMAEFFATELEERGLAPWLLSDAVSDLITTGTEFLEAIEGHRRFRGIDLEPETRKPFAAALERAKQEASK